MDGVFAVHDAVLLVKDAGNLVHGCRAHRLEHLLGELDARGVDEAELDPAPGDHGVEQAAVAVEDEAARIRESVK